MEGGGWGCELEKARKKEEKKKRKKKGKEGLGRGVGPGMFDDDRTCLFDGRKLKNGAGKETDERRVKTAPLI